MQSLLYKSTAVLLLFAGAASAQTTAFTAYEICGDAPGTGVPQLRGTCGLDLNGTQILVANQFTGTVTLHQIGSPTTLDGIISVPTVGPEYDDGPRGAVFYHGNRNGREDGIIICTYDGLICTGKATPHARTGAVIRVNHFALGARYVALDVRGGGHLSPGIYVANESARQIEQYSHLWRWVRSFRDTGLGSDYEPVSLFVSGDLLYSGWRFVVPPGQDASQAPPSYVCVFNLNGRFVRHFPVGHSLGFFPPVGMAITPPHFGDLSNVLAVCDAQFVRFWDPLTGASLGVMEKWGPYPAPYPPLWLDGITSLKSDGDSRLYFTISAQSEYDGAIGYLEAQP